MGVCVAAQSSRGEAGHFQHHSASRSGSAQLSSGTRDRLNDVEPRKLLRGASRKRVGPAGPSGTGFSTSEVEILLIDYICSPMRSSKRMSAEEMVSSYFPATAVQLLNLARDWIWTYLPHVLSKVHRVSFGLLQESDRNRWKNQIIAAAGGDVTAAADFTIAKTRWLLSVPFIGKDVPSRAAEFAHPDILLGLSILAYRYNGLRDSDMRRVVKDLRRNLLNEPGPFSERPSRILFEDWKSKAVAQWTARQQVVDKNMGSTESISQPELLPLELLQVDDPSQLGSVMLLLSKLPEVVVHYLNKLVFPAVMKHRSVKLQASGVDLGSDMIFGTRLGFQAPRLICFLVSFAHAITSRVLRPKSFACSHLPPTSTVNLSWENGVWTLFCATLPLGVRVDASTLP